MNENIKNPNCPECETLTRKTGKKILAGGKRLQAYQCKNCGRYYTEKTILGGV